MRAGICVLILLGGVIGAGCAYRLSAPPDLGESVRVVVVSNDARLVRAQAYLQSSVATALQNRLGWSVSPSGSAKLELTIAQETIRDVGNDSRDIPVRWSITLQGQALLASQRGAITNHYSGIGYSAGLSDEAQALQAAADNAAQLIAVWLESAGKDWK